MGRPKILLAAAKAGGGHIALRDFLYKQLQEGDKYKLVKFDHPGKTLENANDLVPKYTPFIHEFFFFFSPRYMSDFFLFATISFFRQCYKVLKQEKPDIVLATHFVLSMHFALAKKLLKLDTVIINCIPDYGPPSKLMHPKFKPFRANKIMVFDQWSAQKAMQILDLKPDEILLAGYNPPAIFAQIAGKFTSKQQAREMLKKRFDYFPYQEIDTKKTTVLITAGASFARKSIPLLKKIAHEQKADQALVNRFQYFVICGKDTDMFESLHKLNKKFRYWSNIFPFSWVDPEVFAQIQFACDLPILGSIAPATLNELLETECGPLIIYKTRPGQELAHRAYIEEKGLGKYIPQSQKIIAELIKIADDTEARTSFLAKAKSFRQDQAERAKHIQELIDKLCLQYGIEQNEPPLTEAHS